MCCDPGEMRGAHGSCCCESTCCTPHFFVRRFISSKERLERLESYREQLEKEIAGIEERIQELKSCAE
jgi:hypothetical protein